MFLLWLQKDSDCKVTQTDLNETQNDDKAIENDYKNSGIFACLCPGETYIWPYLNEGGEEGKREGLQKRILKYVEELEDSQRYCQFILKY